MPNPLCESANHTFVNFNRVLSNSTYYTGNATEYDWTIDEGQIINTNSSGGEMALILTETNGAPVSRPHATSTMVPSPPDLKPAAGQALLRHLLP